MGKHSAKNRITSVSNDGLFMIDNIAITSKLMIGCASCLVIMGLCAGVSMFIPVSSYAENVSDDKATVSAVRNFTPYDADAISKHDVPSPNVGIMLKNDKNRALSEEKAKQDELLKQQQKAAEKARQDAYDRWHNPTGGAYPDVSNAVNNGTLSIQVNLSEQKVYIQDNGNTVYTMIASTGMNDSTPHGDYTIGMRGENFYNPNERMGANYWTGFIGGTYLFHTVPTDVNGNYIETEADKLGVPASHGCVRLSISDAKWIHDMIPSGTPVHIA